jgi:hypothetical protein
MTAALAAIRHLLDVSHTIPDLALLRVKLGNGQLGRVDHDQHTLTICASVSEPEIAAEVFLHQLARLDHGRGREHQALRDTLQMLAPTEDQPLTESRAEELAAHLHVPMDAIRTAMR